jgi:hypothetical protein
MTSTLTQDRRVSGMTDRRGRLGRRRGRRVEDHGSFGPMPLVPCAACGEKGSAMYAVTYQHGKRMATYGCASCGHFFEHCVQAEEAY